MRVVLEHWKEVAQAISYVVGIVGAILAVTTYRSNSQRERARWAVQLYEKFFEGQLYKGIREALDREPSFDKQVLARIGNLAANEPTATFTDYLNFCELVSFLSETKQLSRSDVLKLFDYYLRCLTRHPEVLDYINAEDNGFEQLSRFLRTLEP